MNKDLIYFPASLLAQGIRVGVFSSRDVLEACLDQIKRLNPDLNAIVTLDDAGARQRALEADQALERGETWGLLHGLPVTVQDTLAVKDMRTTRGDPALANHVPKEDSPLVSRLRSAGAIIMGKTNVSPVSRGAFTANPVFGITKHPWDLSRSTGAGAGGGAAAVSAGLTPLDFGTDLGGSLRMPAALCGIFAFKFTSGRVPVEDGQILEGIGAVEPVSAPGPLARSIQDLSLAYNVLLGSGASPSISITERKFKERRIAWTDQLGDLPPSSEVSAAIQDFIGALTRQGAKAEKQVNPGFDLTKAWQVGGLFIGGLEAPASGGMSRLFRRFLNAKPQWEGPGSAILQGMSAGPDVFRQRETLEKLVLERRSISTAFDRFFAAWDVWICPVFPTPAIANPSAADRSADPFTLKMDVGGKPVSQVAAGLAYNLLFNLTGNPVVVFPISVTSTGLPISVQMVGRRGMETDLLSLAETIVEIGSGYQRPPRLE